MSDCGITTDKIDQAIANYCSDTTKELDNLTEELKSDSELEFTMNKMNNINIRNDIEEIRSQKHDLLTKQLLRDDVDGYMISGVNNDFDEQIANHRERERSTSPFYARLNEKVEENNINNLLYTEQKPMSSTDSARPNIYHHQNSNLNDFTNAISTNSVYNGCNELMLHSVNLDDGI